MKKTYISILAWILACLLSACQQEQEPVPYFIPQTDEVVENVTVWWTVEGDEIVQLPGLNDTVDPTESTEPIIDATESTEPAETTAPEITVPDATEPEVTEPETVEPETVEPETVEPAEPDASIPMETAPAEHKCMPACVMYAPTCTRDGYFESACGCGYHSREEYPATGHEWVVQYEMTTEVSSVTVKMCTTCGAQEVILTGVVNQETTENATVVHTAGIE